MLLSFCLDRACVVVAISISNVWVALVPPTALVNKEGASFSLLLCFYFASTVHVWRRRFVHFKHNCWHHDGVSECKGKILPSPIRLGRVSHYIATLNVSMQICQVRILMPNGFSRLRAALVNKQGASFSRLFCICFATTGHVWWWQFRFSMSELLPGLPPHW